MPRGRYLLAQIVLLWGQGLYSGPMIIWRTLLIDLWVLFDCPFIQWLWLCGTPDTVCVCYTLTRSNPAQSVDVAAWVTALPCFIQPGHELTPVIAGGTEGTLTLAEASYDHPGYLPVLRVIGTILSPNQVTSLPHIEHMSSRLLEAAWGLITPNARHIIAKITF